MASLPSPSDPAPWREISLSPGEQVVINGALVSCDGPARIQVGGGACLVTGKNRSAPSVDGGNVVGRLYYGTLLAISRDPTLQSEKRKLMKLLNECVIAAHTRKGQEICAAYAMALTSGDGEACMEQALLLAGATA